MSSEHKVLHNTCPTCHSQIQGTCLDKYHYERVEKEPFEPEPPGEKLWSIERTAETADREWRYDDVILPHQVTVPEDLRNLYEFAGRSDQYCGYVRQLIERLGAAEQQLKEALDRESAVRQTCNFAVRAANECGNKLGAVGRERDRLKEQMARCGKENCMGWQMEGTANWVRKEALDAANAKVTSLSATRDEIRREALADLCMAIGGIDAAEFTKADAMTAIRTLIEAKA